MAALLRPLLCPLRQLPVASTSQAKSYATEVVPAIFKPKPKPKSADKVDPSNAPLLVKARRSLMDPQRRVIIKRKSRKSWPVNPGLGARVPRKANDLSQKVFFPNFTFVLCRNGPRHASDPYTATFIVPKQLTKPDIVAFLTQAYNLKVLGIRTTTEHGEVQDIPRLTQARGGLPGPRTLRLKTTKKAIITMDQPFWYPRRESPSFFASEFDTDVQKANRQRALMQAGNREKPGFDGRSRRFRNTSPYLKTVIKERQRRRFRHERQTTRGLEATRTRNRQAYESQIEASQSESSQQEVSA